MMPAGLQPVELEVHHVRHPRQRMPVTGISGIEGPGDTLTCESGLDVLVLRHIRIVIEVGEVAVEHPPERPDGDGQQEKDYECKIARVRTAVVYLPGLGIFLASSLTKSG